MVTTNSTNNSRQNISKHYIKNVFQDTTKTTPGNTSEIPQDILAGLSTGIRVKPTKATTSGSTLQNCLKQISSELALQLPSRFFFF